jgi:linoleoyl-CoA desaturase
MWKRMHNVAHHTYTNVDGYDGDIEPFPLIRISPYAKYFKIHKWQYIYAYFFYGLGTLSWVFIKDYVKFFQNKVGNYNGQDHARKEYFYLFFYKFLNYSLYLVVPFVFIEAPWYHILGGFLVMHWVSGFCLASIFMLAHALEQVTFDKPDEEGNLRDSFHTHQLSTTVNFATKSKLAAFLTGGLNQQVEHHLFPAICSCHYPALADVVRKTAEEYDQPYQELSFTEALASHNRFLKDMGDVRFMGK